MEFYFTFFIMFIIFNHLDSISKQEAWRLHVQSFSGSGIIFYNFLQTSGTEWQLLDCTVIGPD
jgi:hypothetical protein